MKKLLLLGSCFALAVSLQAQNNRIIKAPGLRENVTPKMRLDVSTNLTNTNRHYVRPVHASKNPSNNSVAAATSVTGKTQVGSSINVFGDILSEGNNMNADNNLGLVVRSHRANSTYVNAATPLAGSGDFNASFTTNYCGGTWDSTRVTSHPTSTAWGIALRYPTGAIYNPPGNTTPNMAYAVGAGPWHIGGIWSGGFFTSGRLDGSTYDYLDTIASNPSTTLFDNQMPRIGSCVGDNGVFHVLGDNFDWGTASGTIFGLYAYSSIFNSGPNHWSHPVGYYMDLSVDEANDFGNMAFSQDGLIGYVAVPARDIANCQGNIIPVIWRTADAGITWTRLPFNDYRNSACWEAIFGSDTTDLGQRIPYFSSTDGWDMTVDKWGNMHLVTTVYASAYDEINCDHDSSDFIYPTQHIVDFYGNGVTTGFAAYKVADLLTTYVPLASSPWINAGTGIGLFARIQVGRTQDGSRIFYGWVDSDPGIDPTNLFPDIHVAGMNVDTYMAAAETNVTTGTSWAEQNFWMYLSATVLSNAGTYTIPMSTTDSWDPNAPGGADVEHWAVCGVTMNDADFTNSTCPPPPVGIAEISSINGNSISQNYPNPFNGMTSFDLTLAHSSTVSVEVTNYLGQIVSSIAEKKYESGVHKIDLNATPLNSGLYFYTVKIGNDRISKKMMIY